MAVGSNGVHGFVLRIREDKDGWLLQRALTGQERSLTPRSSANLELSGKFGRQQRFVKCDF